MEKLLKLDPGNTELLAQRHRLLGQAVSETKEKLETLKTAADFDSAMSQVAAVSGATGADLEALLDKAREMGSKTKFSASEAAEAIGLMANAGIKSSQAGTSLRAIMNNLAGDVKICGSNIGEVTVATTNVDGSMRDLSDILADCRAAFAGLSESEKAAAAVDAIILLYQKCKWFRDAVNAVWAQVKEFFVSAWEAVCSFFTETIPAAWESLVSLFDQIPAWWSGLWQSVGDFFVNIWTGMMENPVLSGIVDMIRSG